MRSHSLSLFGVFLVLALISVPSFGQSSINLINGDFNAGQLGWFTSDPLPPAQPSGYISFYQGSLTVSAYPTPDLPTSSHWVYQTVTLPNLDQRLIAEMETLVSGTNPNLQTFVGLRLTYRDTSHDPLHTSYHREISPEGILLSDDCRAASPELVSEVVVRFEASGYREFLSGDSVGGTVSVNTVEILPKDGYDLTGYQLSGAHLAPSTLDVVDTR